MVDQLIPDGKFKIGRPVGPVYLELRISSINFLVTKDLHDFQKIRRRNGLVIESTPGPILPAGAHRLG